MRDKRRFGFALCRRRPNKIGEPSSVRRFRLRFRLGRRGGSRRPRADALPKQFDLAFEGFVFALEAAAQIADLHNQRVDFLPDFGVANGDTFNDHLGEGVDGGGVAIALASTPRPLVTCAINHSGASANASALSTDQEYLRPDGWTLGGLKI